MVAIGSTRGACIDRDAAPEYSAGERRRTVRLELLITNIRSLLVYNMPERWRGQSRPQLNRGSAVARNLRTVCRVTWRDVVSVLWFPVSFTGDRDVHLHLHQRASGLCSFRRPECGRAFQRSGADVLGSNHSL